MDEQWFAASMRIVCLIEGDGATTQDEVVHTFRVAGWEEAFRRAIDLECGGLGAGPLEFVDQAHPEPHARGWYLVEWRVPRGWDHVDQTKAKARSHEREYLNSDGERVRWRLERVLTLDIIQNNDLEGAEVFSQRSDVSGGSPFDSVFDPESHRPRQTGI